MVESQKKLNSPFLNKLLNIDKRIAKLANNHELFKITSKERLNHDVKILEMFAQFKIDDILKKYVLKTDLDQIEKTLKSDFSHIYNLAAKKLSQEKKRKQIKNVNNFTNNLKTKIVSLLSKEEGLVIKESLVLLGKTIKSDFNSNRQVIDVQLDQLVAGYLIEDWQETKESIMSEFDHICQQSEQAQHELQAKLVVLKHTYQEKYERNRLKAIKGIQKHDSKTIRDVKIDKIKTSTKNRLIKLNENYTNNINNKTEQYEIRKFKLIEQRDFQINAGNLDSEKYKLRIKSFEERNHLNENVVLSISNLTMKFGGLVAVDDLSLEIKQNDIFGLIGPNGAGKTTVFNCITKFYVPNSGKIVFRKNNNARIYDLSEIKVHNIIKTGMARSFQNVELVWELSVLDNLLVGAHSSYSSGVFGSVFRTNKRKYEERIVLKKAEEILKTFDIYQYKDFYPIGLAYGILKKIEFARTLMTSPGLIILDEPAAGLNEYETAELAQLIIKIRDDFDCTILLVEHDMGLVMSVCNQICAISFGKMLAIGDPNYIQNHPMVKEAYLGGEL